MGAAISAQINQYFKLDLGSTGLGIGAIVICLFYALMFHPEQFAFALCMVALATALALLLWHAWDHPESVAPLQECLLPSQFDQSRAQVDAKLDEGIYRFSTSKWAKCFMYMQDNKDGNVRGWDQEDPGPQGWFRLRHVVDATGKKTAYWFIEPLAFQNWSVYMQDNGDGNVRGWNGDPGPQGHWKIETHQMKEKSYRFSTKKWPTHYMYMQDNSDGNVRGWEEDPGDQGWWTVSKSLFSKTNLFQPKTNLTYRMTTAKWRNCYMYMQDNGDGNVRGWNKEDPGPQGHFKFIRRAKDLWLIHPVKWPTWYVYMQDNKDGNVRGWEGDPGPQGHWRIEAHMFEKDVFRLMPSSWPNDVMYMQNNSDGNVRSWKSDAGPQGWWYIKPI